MKPRETTLLLCAIQFLTRLPTPAIAGFDTAWINRSAKYFPLVGQIVGGLCGLVLLAAAKLWEGWLPVLLAMTAGILITGALHEDGLADTVDGLGGGSDRERRLAIMKDSRLGVYGALAVGLCLAIKSAALAALPVHTAALLLIAIHGGGRAATVVAMHTMTYGGNTDTAKIKTATASVTRGECLVAAALALWPLLFLDPRQAIAGLACGSLAAILPAYAAKRLIGGQTGDILGAIEQMFEAGFLLGATMSLEKPELMKIIVSPLVEAAALVADRKPGRVLSLVSPETEVPSWGGADSHLILRFHDIPAPEAGFVAADLSVVQAMLDFGRTWDRTTPFLIHCWAGISRSTAAAYVLACQYGREGGEEAAAKALRRASPSATPNVLVVQLADHLLRRQGRMSSAIAGIGRGADAAFGTPFELPVD